MSVSRSPAAGRAVAVGGSHCALGLSDDDAIGMYYAMLVSRRLSARSLQLAMQGVIDVAIPTDGHEAAQVASIRALRITDPVYLYYRSAAAAYARGMTAFEILLDYLGRADGPSSGGKNLSGHWAKRELRLMTVSGSVATHIPHAVGSALAARLRGENHVVVAYFGDGGSSKADFFEALNFAAIHRLPVILFCENNDIAISVPFDKQSSVRNVAARAIECGVSGVSVDGTSPLEVYRATAEAAQRARAGAGPTLIEARVARLGQHTSQVSDRREAAVLAATRARDPIPYFERYLRGAGLLDDALAAGISERANSEVEDGLERALAAAWPSVERAFQDVLGSAS